jgi:hypothetical protein
MNNANPLSVRSRLQTPITVRSLWTCTLIGAVMLPIADRWGVFPGVLIGLGLAATLLLISLRFPAGRAARWYDIALALAFLSVMAGGSYCLHDVSHRSIHGSADLSRSWTAMGHITSSRAG